MDHHAYPGSWDTENVYIDALLLLSSRERHRLKVIIDIIGGTSAGGINGVVLAQALAINGSQDGIKKLWIQEGGVEQLVREPGSKPGFGSKAINRVDDMLARFSNHFSPGLFRNTSAIAGSAVKILGDSKEALFSGANYGIKLHDAFRTVAASALPSAVVNIDPSEINNSPLVPNKLELLATCTNVRGVRGPVMAGSNADGRVTNVSYRQVMKFVHEGEGRSSFGGKFTSALAFAARATSSFPGKHGERLTILCIALTLITLAQAPSLPSRSTPSPKPSAPPSTSTLPTPSLPASNMPPDRPTPPLRIGARPSRSPTQQPTVMGALPTTSPSSWSSTPFATSKLRYRLRASSSTSSRIPRRMSSLMLRESCRPCWRH